MNTKILKSAILGHAVGDALGVPVEFSDRTELDTDPVTSMRGFGTYEVPAGAWSDDTSMILCELDAVGNGDCSSKALMDNFVKWYKDGEFTPEGKMFDIGGTCETAIINYISGRGDADHCGLDGEFSNGNGSLMRILPFALLYSDAGAPVEERLEHIYAASALTHSHFRSKMSCGIFSFIVWELLGEQGKAAVYRGLENAYRYYSSTVSDFAADIYSERLFKKIACIPGIDGEEGTCDPLTRNEINSSGYVVDTLEAAVWCLINTDSYRDCVLAAVNLGRDTDTTAAVAGGLAGIMYGYEAIPVEWLEILMRKDYIENLCEKAAPAMPGDIDANS